jgi:hypothetical protein
LYVWWGKAGKGSAPKRRSMLTLFPRSARVIAQWIGQCRELAPTAQASSSLWPSERSGRLAQEKLGARFADYRDALGLPGELSLHAVGNENARPVS